MRFSKLAVWPLAAIGSIVTAAPSAPLVTDGAASNSTASNSTASNSTGEFGLEEREYTGLPSQWLKSQSTPWYRSRATCRELFSIQNDVCNPNKHIDSLDACVLFRSLEWLTYALTFNAQIIQASDRNRFFDMPHTEGGDLAVVLRGIILWRDLLWNLEVQLQGTRSLSINEQLKIVRCYLDYTLQGDSLLRALGDKGQDFDEKDPLKCIVFDVIEELYIAYKNAADLLYSTHTAIRPMWTENFPKGLPDFWDDKHGKPKAGDSIAEYVRSRDLPIMKDGLAFKNAQSLWKCIDTRKQSPEPLWGTEEWYQPAPVDGWFIPHK